MLLGGISKSETKITISTNSYCYAAIYVSNWGRLNWWVNYDNRQEDLTGDR